MTEIKFLPLQHTSRLWRQLAWASVALSLLSACATPGPAPLRIGSAGSDSAVFQNAGRPGGGIRVDVRRGDSVYGLSQRYGSTARAIIDANSLQPPYVLQPGQRLFIPNATMHVVVKGETLYGISRLYHVDMTSIAKLNGLREPYRLGINQLLKVPSVGFAERRSGASPGTSVATNTNSQRTASQESRPARQAQLPEPAPRSGKDFAWPLRGNVVMPFGPRPDGYHNDGINIAVPSGTSVRSAENGVVGYAGNELMGYGNLILVRHGDGWITAYAHNSEILVERGDQVKRGEVIAKSGDTGKVTQPQLHFEVRRGKKAINPIEHLVTEAPRFAAGRFARLGSHQ